MNNLTENKNKRCLKRNSKNEGEIYRLNKLNIFKTRDNNKNKSKIKLASMEDNWLKVDRTSRMTSFNYLNKNNSLSKVKDSNNLKSHSNIYKSLFNSWKFPYHQSN